MSLAWRLVSPSALRFKMAMKLVDLIERCGADPWGTACFNVTTGDVEDAPAPNALHKFDVFEEGGAVYIKGAEEAIKPGGRTTVTSCMVTQPETVVIVGG